MEKKIRFSNTDRTRHEKRWTAWWKGELNQPMVVFENPESSPRFVCNFPLDTPVSEVIHRYQQQLETETYYGDSWPRWWINFGPGIAAGFLGAKVNREKDTVWFEPETDTNIQTMRLSYREDNLWWNYIRNLTQAAVETWGNEVCVGFTDLGGNLDILASLRTTQKLLFELYDEPEEVSRLASEITRLWIRYYNELYSIIEKAGSGTCPWAPIWSPARCYMLQSDFSYMVSPEMFERFILPDLASCCDHLEHAFYHLDGKGQIPHLDMLLSLRNLRGIQWIPGDGQPPPEEWLPLLKQIRDSGKLCQLYVTSKGALTIARELGGKGFAFCISDLTQEEEIKGFLNTINREV